MTTNNSTVADIAKLAQVAPEEVLTVLLGQNLDPDKQRHILDIIGQVGIVEVDAPQITAKSHKSIAVIMMGMLTEDFVGQIIQGVSERSQQLNFSMTLYMQAFSNQANLTEKYRPLFTSGQTSDGFLIMIPQNANTLLRLCQEYHRPCVVFDEPCDEDISQQAAILTNNRQGIIDVMQHLFNLGHQRIGIITGLRSLASGRERLQGYKDALAAAGFPIDDRLIVEGNYTSEAGKVQARRLLELDNPPTAIVCSNDPMALGALETIQEMNLRVPEDVSLVGFDDIEMASTIYPSLTTVRQHMVEMGQTAVDMLAALMQGQRFPNPHRLFPTELIIRQSTGRARR